MEKQDGPFSIDLLVEVVLTIFDATASLYPWMLPTLCLLSKSYQSKFYDAAHRNLHLTKVGQWDALKRNGWPSLDCQGNEKEHEGPPKRRALFLHYFDEDGSHEEMFDGFDDIPGSEQIETLGLRVFPSEFMYTSLSLCRTRSFSHLKNLYVDNTRVPPYTNIEEAEQIDSFIKF